MRPMITHWHQTVRAEWLPNIKESWVAHMLDVLAELLDIPPDDDKYVYISEMIRMGLDSGLLTRSERCDMREYIVGKWGWL